jgi:hypothetical protein
MLKFIFNLRDSIIISNSFSTDDKVFSTKDMWSINYVGLYCQYAAVGLLYGSSGTLIPFCAYAFKGSTNVCANAKNITFFAWNIKLFFAILTDCIRPFGMRRKPWMIMGYIPSFLTYQINGLNSLLCFRLGDGINPSACAGNKFLLHVCFSLAVHIAIPSRLYDAQ